jgi:ribulose-bisphosphate carboxylase small chain
MKLTQGCFSYLNDLNDDEIRSQIEYAIEQSWAISIEYTDDPHPRNAYWEMWGLPLFDVKDPKAVLFEIKVARKAKPNHYIKVAGFDNTRGVESCSISFIVSRPSYEPGFKLVRQEVQGRSLVYTLESYATNAKPTDERYSISPFTLSF